MRHLRDLGIAFNRPFLLHVGGNFNYKNREGLFRLFAQFLRLDGCGDYHLVLAGAGRDDKLQSLSQELGIERQVREAGEVTNEQLCALYSTAEALVFPSLHEGFGWPIVEAQACGCPVFTTNRRPMSEVGGDGALYFDPADEAAAARIVLEGLKHKKQLVVLGFRNAAKYKADAMIDAYLTCYESFLNH
jgi:glycosyltransferase involved in cell wall biosynthesis